MRDARPCSNPNGSILQQDSGKGRSPQVWQCADPEWMLHLQSSTFALLEGIQLPSSLQSLTFVDELNQSRESIQLPGSQFDVWRHV